MAAGRWEIGRWFDEGKRDGYAYMIVVCDTFDWEDYPTYAKDARQALDKYAHFNGQNMQRVMEVYDLNADKGEQLKEQRTFRLPVASDVRG